jgi:peptidyl-tRNA hydrolase, PTH1 family
VETLLIVGLGNPGSEYSDTRHNVGFMVLEKLSLKLRAKIRPGKGEYYYGRARVGSSDCILITPLTYMNNSGEAVAEALTTFSVDPNRMVVVYDDVAIPFGTIRIRPKGTDGGHNGVYSIIYHLRTVEFPRIRCGIRKEDMRGELSDFVLSPFDEKECTGVKQMTERAAEAALTIAHSGLHRAMDLFNN